MNFIKKAMFFCFMLFSISLMAQNKENGKAEIKTSVVCDHCKACETCGLSFKENLMKLKGMRMYEFDEEKKTITVFYNPKKLDLLTIKTTISKLGFDADDVKADADAYAKLDGCCKA